MPSFMGLIQQWLSKERRKARRLPAEELSAYYWTGAAPVEHSIRDISNTGLFLLTDERWYPGTLVKMTLQKKDEEANYTERAISVQSKAVRWGDDGVGLEFVLRDGRNRNRGEGMLEDSVDRKSLEKFLKDYRLDDLVAIVLEVEPPKRKSLDPNMARP